LPQYIVDHRLVGPVDVSGMGYDAAQFYISSSVVRP
jgi:hypothetical protein